MHTHNDTPIVVTRDAKGNAVWGNRLKTIGYDVYSLPTIETIPLQLTTEHETTLKHLADFDWIIFTSTAAVRFLYDKVHQLGDQWPPVGPKVAAIGQHTARQLKAIGIEVDFLPSQATSVTLANEFPPAAGQALLLPRTTIASNELPDALRRCGASVTTLPLYTTRPIDMPDSNFMRQLQIGKKPFILFASPSAVRGFIRRITDRDLLEQAKSLPVIAIGPSTKAALHAAGFQTIHISPTASLEGIIAILQQLIK